MTVDNEAPSISSTPVSSIAMPNLSSPADHHCVADWSRSPVHQQPDPSVTLENAPESLLAAFDSELRARDSEMTQPVEAGIPTPSSLQETTRIPPNAGMELGSFQGAVNGERVKRNVASEAVASSSAPMDDVEDMFNLDPSSPSAAMPVQPTPEEEEAELLLLKQDELGFPDFVHYPEDMEDVEDGSTDRRDSNHFSATSDASMAQASGFSITRELPSNANPAISESLSVDASVMPDRETTELQPDETRRPVSRSVSMTRELPSSANPAIVESQSVEPDRENVELPSAPHDHTQHDDSAHPETSRIPILIHVEASFIVDPPQEDKQPAESEEFPGEGGSAEILKPSSPHPSSEALPCIQATVESVSEHNDVSDSISRPDNVENGAQNGQQMDITEDNSPPSRNSLLPVQKKDAEVSQSNVDAKDTTEDLHDSLLPVDQGPKVSQSNADAMDTMENLLSPSHHSLAPIQQAEEPDIGALFGEWALKMECPSFLSNVGKVAGNLSAERQMELRTWLESQMSTSRPTYRDVEVQTVRVERSTTPVLSTRYISAAPSDRPVFGPPRYSYSSSPGRFQSTADSCAISFNPAARATLAGSPLTSFSRRATPGPSYTAPRMPPLFTPSPDRGRTPRDRRKSHEREKETPREKLVIRIPRIVSKPGSVSSAPPTPSPAQKFLKTPTERRVSDSSSVSSGPARMSSSNTAASGSFRYQNLQWNSAPPAVDYYRSSVYEQSAFESVPLPMPALSRSLLRRPRKPEYSVQPEPAAEQVPRETTPTTRDPDLDKVVPQREGPEADQEEDELLLVPAPRDQESARAEKVHEPQREEREEDIGQIEETAPRESDEAREEVEPPVNQVLETVEVSQFVGSVSAPPRLRAKENIKMEETLSTSLSKRRLESPDSDGPAPKRSRRKESGTKRPATEQIQSASSRRPRLSLPSSSSATSSTVISSSSTVVGLEPSAGLHDKMYTPMRVFAARNESNPETSAAWQKLLTVWFEFERVSASFPGALSKTGRPESVHDWIGRARKMTWRPWRTQSNPEQWLVKFQPVFTAWWDGMKGEPTVVKQAGQNGMLSIVACLFWWAECVDVLQGYQGKEDWLRIVEELTAVVESK
ncbi:hypothetical protein C8J56DRAFT_949350 [Mycena floridula]|nr:hypothetical protein C8J56DRAFT_949350 [Mycena floridula]